MTDKTKAAGLDTRATLTEPLHPDYLILLESAQAKSLVKIVAQIQRILDTHPDLLNHGWRTPSDPATPLEITLKIIRQVQLTLAYLATNKISLTTSSYDLKHHVERWAHKNKIEPNTYVKNSSAIVGALLSGYVPVLLKVNGTPYQNVRFKRGERK